MKLIFEDHDTGLRTVIKGDCKTDEEVSETMWAYLKEIEFKSYYFRYWLRDDETVCDFGSHTKFFIIQGR